MPSLTAPAVTQVRRCTGGIANETPNRWGFFFSPRVTPRATDCNATTSCVGDVCVESTGGTLDPSDKVEKMGSVRNPRNKGVDKMNASSESIKATVPFAYDGEHYEAMLSEATGRSKLSTTPLQVTIYRRRPEGGWSPVIACMDWEDDCAKRGWIGRDAPTPEVRDALGFHATNARRAHNGIALLP